MKKYSDKVYRLCLSMCNSAFDAEDAAQDAFIDAFLYLPSLGDAGKFGSWLCTIARRKAYHVISSRGTYEDVDELRDFLPSEGSTPVEDQLKAERREQIMRALGRLTEKKRTVAEMFYFGSMSIAEIAQSLNISVNAVKSRLYDVREYLRKELDDMDENKDNIIKLEDRIKKKIEELTHYYNRYGNDRSKYWNEIDKTLEELETVEDNEKRQYLSVWFLQQKSRQRELSESEREEFGKRCKIAAEEGRHADWQAYDLINRSYRETLDDISRLCFIDGLAIPKIKKLAGSPDYENALGMLYFERGKVLCRMFRGEEAKAEFEKAAKVLKDNCMRVCALAYLKTYERMKEKAYDDVRGIHAGAECLRLHDGVVTFEDERFVANHFGLPGIDNSYSTFYDDAARFGGVVLDENMKSGKVNDAFLECVANDETVSVPAGEFANCLHIKTVSNSNDKYSFSMDMWYAPQVGVVKAVGQSTENTEVYELTEYSAEGKGYLPLNVGNRWVYENPNLPKSIYGTVEHTVEYSDGESAVISVVSPLTVSKDYKESGALDSSVFLAFADELCEKWKIDEAVEMLKNAVRLNVNEDAVRISLYGIEVLSRFSEYYKKGYRFCPSSIGAFVVRAADGKVEQTDYLTSFGPYKYGHRGRYEDRIFGIKPFRYLDRFTDKLWDPAWVPGYTHEEEIVFGRKILLNVEEGGTVSVPAGEFDNCRKLTFRVDKPEGKSDHWYFEDSYMNVECGIKEYWFAPGVGIVKTASTWGEECYAECVLSKYSVPAAGLNEFLPIEIGNSWEYDEPHLTAEGYRAKAIFRVQSGMNGRFLMTASQEFICFMSEEEYDKFSEESHKY